MPEFSTPSRRRHDTPGMRTFLSPRKSLIAVGVVCALSAAALFVGRMRAATSAVGADNPSPASHAPTDAQEARVHP
jgi:hypothetical protein